jgi:hypothetical protein
MVVKVLYSVYFRLFRENLNFHYACFRDSVNHREPFGGHPESSEGPAVLRNGKAGSSRCSE